MNRLVSYAGSAGGQHAVPMSKETLAVLTDTSGTAEQCGMRLLKPLFPESYRKANPAYAASFPVPAEQASPAAIERQNQAIGGWKGVWSGLKGITAPALFVTGAEDVIAPAENATLMAKVVPGAELVSIPGALIPRSEPRSPEPRTLGVTATQERRRMTQDQDRTPAQSPADFQEYADARFGFKVMMPKRFEILPDTVDPLARMIRGLNDISEEEATKLQPRLPIGFFDPDVLGELEDGSKQPLRLIEYEVLGGREEPLGDEEIEQLHAEMREYLPETLASAQMPGYEFLGTRETRLGPLPALAFEYRWDGVRPGFFGGDHARIVWALGPTAMFHVYHHCSGEVWGARRSELDAILASFALMEPGEVAEEAARGAAVAAFEAAKAAGDSTEVAFQAGQAAYEAAHAAGGAPQEGTDSETD